MCNSLVISSLILHVAPRWYPACATPSALSLQLSADSLNFFFFADDEPNCAQADSGGLSPGAIVGISIGCIINLAVVVAALYWVRIS